MDNFKMKIFLVMILSMYSCEKSKERNHIKVQYQKISANRAFPQGVIIDGLRQGIWISYDTLGHIRSSVSYVNGLENGEFRLFSELGILVQRVDIHDGKYEGNFEFYNYKGGIYLKGIYKDNKRTGKWYVYNDNGKLADEETWENGKLLKKIKMK
jgi:antitoxin component YwqK of YwqJK toxin-antitoxin module